MTFKRFAGAEKIKSRAIVVVTVTQDTTVKRRLRPLMSLNASYFSHHMKDAPAPNNVLTTFIVGTPTLTALPFLKGKRIPDNVYPCIPSEMLIIMDGTLRIQRIKNLSHHMIS